MNAKIAQEREGGSQSELVVMNVPVHSLNCGKLKAAPND
jgi:hypothetical protein